MLKLFSSEKKELRSLAALGVIKVVRTIWLEDCDREKKEIPVLQRHMAYDLLLPKDAVCLNKGATVGMTGMKQGKISAVPCSIPADQIRGSMSSGSGMSLEKSREGTMEINMMGTDL
ncbi:hypothetical protein L1049_016155 [Liquidambar formosana]|uniref:BRCT domain-containing protein n=1 Tax=Liquidambar formosana TaxID=63359 RepID=A0AAP0S4Q3_LIQFO